MSTMCRPHYTLPQENEEGGLELETLSETMGMGAPALHVHAYEYQTEDFQLEVGREADHDLLPVPEIYLRRTRSTMPHTLPAFKQAVLAMKGWWTEEFTFRGFGVGVVKPLFRGLLLRPDIGVGVRCAHLPIMISNFVFKYGNLAITFCCSEIEFHLISCLPWYHQRGRANC